MLKLNRYAQLYWFKHQWNLNNVVSYKFHLFYKKLHNSIVIKKQKNFKKIPILMTKKINYVEKKLIIFSLYFQKKSPIGWMVVEYNKKSRYVICKSVSSLNITTFNVNKKLMGLPVYNFKSRAKTVRFDTGQLPYIKEHIYSYNNLTWDIGYKKLSFFTKKSVMYEKNRKVKKTKILIKFSKMYNFFKNTINVFFKLQRKPKMFIYLYFLKKNNNLSVRLIFKNLAQRFASQKKTPLILDVPYRK